MIELDSSSWSLSMRTQIHFGDGIFARAVSFIQPVGKKRFIVICGQSAVKMGYFDQIKRDLNAFASTVVLYDRISKDPTSVQVQEIVSLIKDENIDGIVAIGGGSAIDAAKAASVIAPLGKSVDDVLGGRAKVGADKIFCIAIPTTAGTGAELSRGAIITSLSQNIKSGVRHDLVSPDIAIVDPILTLTVPQDQVKITGFDIFTHAVETYISKKANPVTEEYSLMAIRSVVKNLPLALESKTDMKSRRQLSFYSMMMGFNLANSSTCLPHRLQYPLGVLTGTEHALGLAALYPAWVKLTQVASEAKFSIISKILAEELNIENQGISNSLMQFMSRIEFEPCLGQFGVTLEQCSIMAELVDGALDNDPWWTSKADLTEFYRLSL